MTELAQPLIQAVVDGDGMLLSADAPLRALNRQAGGQDDGPLVIPQLTAMVRLAQRLKIPISRPVVAKSGANAITMWVRAKAQGQNVHLSVIDWVEPGKGDAGAIPEAQPQHGWQWETDCRLVLKYVAPAPDEAGPAIGDLAGKPFTAWLQLIEDVDGNLPILSGLAAQAAFDGQPALLRADLSRAFRISGTPVHDAGGSVTGYRGSALEEKGAPLGTARPAEGQGSGATSDFTGTDPNFPLPPGFMGQHLDRALRRPLDRIIANADSIHAQVKGPLRADYAGYASDIANAGRHLLALVDDLADLRAIERPNFVVAREMVDLADCGRRAAGLLSVKAGARSIRMETPSPDESVPAAGEFRRVLQILVNLIGNAVRYSPEGSMVRVDAQAEGDIAWLTVSDQGDGIAPESQDLIFEKFERLGRSGDGGSGLGLYISRRLARAMKGDILLESTPGHGARFILALPVWKELDGA